MNEGIGGRLWAYSVGAIWASVMAERLDNIPKVLSAVLIIYTLTHAYGWFKRRWWPVAAAWLAHRRRVAKANKEIERLIREQDEERRAAIRERVIREQESEAGHA